MLWNKSTMTHLYYDSDEADENEPCGVRLDDSGLLIEYDDEDGADRPFRAQYRGPDAGHFKLECVQTGGKATLHRFRDGNLLEGSWLEGGCRGMWRITLKA